MSSTNRGSEKSPQEFYCTRIDTIKDFWVKFCQIENKTIHDFYSILDPCAGGDESRPCSYPEAINSFDTINHKHVVDLRFTTVDIRINSKAYFKEDYLKTTFPPHMMVISNPPFSLFEQFVIKGLSDVYDNGYVIFLLRLNAAGGQSRGVRFWDIYKPKAIYIHRKRPFPDSTEYAHFVWQKGYVGETKFYWV